MTKCFLIMIRLCGFGVRLHHGTTPPPHPLSDTYVKQKILLDRLLITFFLKQAT